MTEPYPGQYEYLTLPTGPVNLTTTQEDLNRLATQGWEPVLAIGETILLRRDKLKNAGIMGNSASASGRGRVLRDVKLVGEIVLDPRYTPPWPGAGIISVREAGQEESR